MGYVGVDVGEATVRKGVLETLPIKGLLTTTGSVKTQFYGKDHNFDDIEYLRVCCHTANDGGSNPILYVDVGGVNKVTGTYANGYHYETIDCTAISGVNAIDIYADITNGDSYIDLTIWVVCS